MWGLSGLVALGVCFCLFVFFWSSASLVGFFFFGSDSTWGFIVWLVKLFLSNSVSVLSSFIRFIILL